MTPKKSNIMKESIQWRTIILVLIVTTTILIGLGGIDYVSIYSNMTQDIKESAKVVTQRLAKSLADPVWNLETEMIYSIIAAEMADKKIYAIHLWEQQDKKLSFGLTRDSSWNIQRIKKQATGHVIKDQKDIIFNQTKIGKVEVLYTLKFVIEAQHDAILNIAFRTIILDITLFLLIFWIISKNISQPLNQIVDFSQKVVDGDLSQLVNINRNDEIGQLASSLNNMISSQRCLVQLSYLRYLPFPIIQIDIDYRITYINDSGMLTFGISQDECLGKSCVELLHMDSIQDNSIWEQVMQDNTLISKEVRISYGRKKNIPVLMTAIPIRSKDEVYGAVGCIIDQSNIYSIIDEVKSITSQLSTSCEELTQISSKMAVSAIEMKKQADAVAHGTFNISDNVSDMATTAEQSSQSVSNIADMAKDMSITLKDLNSLSQKTSDYMKYLAQSGDEMSSNVNNVALAIENMMKSLKDISKSTSKANKFSHEADQQTEAIHSRIEALVTASRQIGKVVSMIKNIADQTNMLALNAAIEAAGAGEAGKGFAVVAGEVKGLARQSADATDEIASQIENIQASTEDAVSTIQKIDSIINEVVSINETISQSIKMQFSAASEVENSVDQSAKFGKKVIDNANEASHFVVKMSNEMKDVLSKVDNIVRNVNDLSTGAKEIATSSSQAAQGVKDISDHIQSINASARFSADNASQVHGASDRLAGMVDSLTKIVNMFSL